MLATTDALSASSIAADIRGKWPMSNAANAKAFIMVIDDSPTVRKILQITLSREGYSGISFADGVTALRWLKESDSSIPDLAFLDLCLPQMNGYQVARALRSMPRCKYMPIVMLTRRDGMLDRLKARLAGVNSFMTKPFTTQQILSAVQQQLLAGTEPTHTRR